VSTPSLLELQARFARELVAEGACDERLAVYRRNLRANYRNALRATYPVVAALVGEVFFDAAVDAFVAADPPKAGDLNVYGGSFAGFLDAYAPAASLAYLPDVARLEWALDEAGRAVDLAPRPHALLQGLHALGAEAAARARFALHPACRLVRCAYPAFAIWRFHQEPGRDLPDVARRPEALLVRCEPERLAVERLADGEAAWLRTLASGAALEEAAQAAIDCDAAFDLGAVLRARIADGTLAAIDRRR
jgi:hypothetical protein